MATLETTTESLDAPDSEGPGDFSGLNEGPQPDWGAVDQAAAESGDAPQGDGTSPPPGAQVATLSPQQFEQSLVGAFAIASALMQIDALKLPADERTTMAAQAIYDTASELPWLRFLIQPGNAYIGRAIVVGSLFWPMGRAVAAEVRAKHANENTPDVDTGPQPAQSQQRRPQQEVFHPDEPMPMARASS